MAGDDRGALLSSGKPATTGWLRAVTPRPAAPGSSAPAIAGVSCPDAGHCVAVDVQGDALTSSNPTGPDVRWSATKIDSAGAFGGAAWSATLTEASPDCTQAPCVAEALWGHDSRGSRVLDAPAPGATGSTISGVAFDGDVLDWIDSGTLRQATLG